MPAVIPTKTAGSLGAALTDTRSPVANELSAVHLERLKSLAIEIATEIGQTNGPADASILGRLGILETGTVGRVQTTGTTPTEVLRITPPQDNGGLCRLSVAAIVSPFAHVAGWRTTFTFLAAGGAAGLSAFFGDSDDVPGAMVGAVISAAEDGADIVVSVTGLAATTIDWVAEAQIVYGLP